MPVYDFRCGRCGTFEDLTPASIESLPCPKCGNASPRQVCAPLRTSTLWGDTPWGINGHYDTGLGRRVSSFKETDKILEKRGWVRESDLGGEMHYERQMDAALLERKTHAETVKTYTENLAKYEGHKDQKGLAIAETFPAKQMLEEAHAHDSNL